MKRCKLIAICLLGIVLCAKAQYQPEARNVFLNAETQQVLDEWNIRYPNTQFHAAFRPYLISTLGDFNDSCLGYSHYPIRNFFLSKTFNEGPDKRNQYNVQVMPIIDLQAGYDMLDKKMVTETSGGAHVKLNINNDFTFAITAIGGRVAYPNFTDTFVKSTKLIPGMGRAFRNADGSYNFSNLTGYLSYSPSKVFNFQLGKDKHFIGDGYRSLLMSDVSNNYPYFRINANIWKIQYNVWYTWMQDFSRYDGTQKSLQNKFGTFHYLSFNATKEFNLAFFENIIWQGNDTNRYRSFDINYLDPIVMFRPQEYSVGSPDNAFIGLNASGKLFRCLKLYAQLALDEFYLKEILAHRGWWANKQGWQFGTKYVNAFGAKGLTLQAEYNEVRPYTYSHGSVQQNYSNYGQALAHPLGANFREFLGFITYRKQRWMLSIQGMYALIGKDTNGVNMGSNIFLSYTTRPYDYGHHTTQGDKFRLLQSDIRFTYYVIPQMNLRFEAGYIQRSESDKQGYALQSPYFYIGLKSSIWNFYRDF